MHTINDKIATLDEQLTALRREASSTTNAIEDRAVQIEADRESAEQAFRQAVTSGGDYVTAWAAIQAAKAAQALLESETKHVAPLHAGKLARLTGERNNLATALARLDDLANAVLQGFPTEDRIHAYLTAARTLGLDLGFGPAPLVGDAERWLVDQFKSQPTWPDVDRAIDAWHVRLFEPLPRAA